MSQPQPTPAPSTKHQAPSASFLSRLHARLGDFWWYSLMMFVALRCGDVINAVVGLWLVPKYVPQEELGAVLPLTQFATTFGLPISILVLVFTKYLAQFKAKGELGKVKSLLRWFLGFVLAASLLSIALAKFTLPALFERIRIQDGSLTLLIIATGIIGTVAPVFNNALQGLKKFKTITFLNLIGAPVRLVSMLLLLPIRALSGYMAGQLIPSIVAIITSAISIRKDINRSIVSIPFWKDNLKPMLKYAFLIAVWVSAGAISSAIQTMIIRQRLPEVESAAYYMLTRFSELATYAGSTLLFVMFPMVTEANARKNRSLVIFLKMAGATAVTGGLCVVALAIIGRHIFDILPMCMPYKNYASELPTLALVGVLGAVSTGYHTYDVAVNRFAFLWYVIPIHVIKVVFLVSFTGHAYFSGILPDAVVAWMGSLHLATLHNILLTLIALNVLNLVCNTVEIAAFQYGIHFKRVRQIQD